MSKTVKSKKLILDNSMLEEDFFEDVVLIGVVCPLASYRFVWQINQAFSYSFCRHHEYEVELKDVYFEVYNFIEPERLTEHNIFTNRKETHFLLEEAKNIDFIWMIKSSYYSKQYATELLESLKKITSVDHCFQIYPKKLKSRQHLIL
jgi:hypothetical protein